METQLFFLVYLEQERQPLVLILIDLYLVMTSMAGLLNYSVKLYLQFVKNCHCLMPMQRECGAERDVKKIEFIYIHPPSCAHTPRAPRRPRPK